MVIEITSQNFPALTSNTISKIVKPVQKKKSNQKDKLMRDQFKKEKMFGAKQKV